MLLGVLLILCKRSLNNLDVAGGAAHLCERSLNSLDIAGGAAHCVRAIAEQLVVGTVGGATIPLLSNYLASLLSGWSSKIHDHPCSCGCVQVGRGKDFAPAGEQRRMYKNEDLSGNTQYPYLGGNYCPPSDADHLFR